MPAAYSWYYLIGLEGCRRWGSAGPVILWEIKCFLCNVLKFYFILHQFKMEWFSPPPLLPHLLLCLKSGVSPWKKACGIKMREVGEKSFQKQICCPVGIKTVNLKSTGLTIIWDFRREIGNCMLFYILVKSSFLLREYHKTSGKSYHCISEPIQKGPNTFARTLQFI